ncbi:hypothetical protein MK805_14430 [Shimazuella sp. AN120528]|uniref:hypothetical protein n=1 Tax=Shimazuella soli TaxID=1892854 RepID=UPI001F0EEA62|nr:hypothetical protein [Shimazuella soli]MCH5586135.1 hypothetical protein [Shimazuella soli]
MRSLLLGVLLLTLAVDVKWHKDQDIQHCNDPEKHIAYRLWEYKVADECHTGYSVNHTKK